MSTDSTLFLGVDLHKDSLTLCGQDRDGSILLRETLAAKCHNLIRNRFTQLAGQHRLAVAVESVGFYQWFWDTVQPVAHELHLADASQVRAAAGRQAKTDQNDAATLARLLRQNSLPEAFVPDPDLRELRAFVRHRQRIQRRCASIKNSLRCEMNKLGLPGPLELNSASLHKWLSAQYGKLSLSARNSCDDLAEELALFESQLRRQDDRLARFIAEHTRFREPIERIMSIPGFGLLTAALVYAETGGLARFEREEEVACYAGLTPRVFQSADSCRHGRIAKSGPPIMRKCLVNAAWTAVRTCPAIRQRFNSIAKRTGKKKAVIAIARKLLCLAWTLEKKKTVFDAARVA